MNALVRWAEMAAQENRAVKMRGAPKHEPWKMGTRKHVLARREIIKGLHQNGLSRADIARQVGCSVQTISVDLIALGFRARARRSDAA